MMVGTVRTFTPERTTDPKVLAMAGQVRVLRRLTAQEADAEAGAMFEVESTATGQRTHALLDELRLVV